MFEPVRKRLRRIDSEDHLTSQKQEDISKELLTEADVGITEYVSTDSMGFACTLKNRWEDFVVREITGGAVVRLTSLNPITSNLYESDADKICDCSVLDPYSEELEELVKGQRKMVRIKGPESKADRTAIHAAVRSKFPTLSSSTVTESEGLLIMVSKSTHSIKGVPTRARARMPKCFPYCRFVLYKEGKDTISAISFLSRSLHVSPSCFSYSGTKDRRAITTQFVTVKGVDSEKLARLNHSMRGIKVGNFSYVTAPQFLGNLDGNQFTIVLRSVVEPVEVISAAVEALKTRGFVNYYGLQRFGHSFKSKSFEIGKHLLRGDWLKAIDLILTPTEADLPLIRQVKERYFQSQDASICAADLPPSLEKYLLQGVAKHGKTLNAIQLLPRNLRQLYVHSYQSLIWNLVASHRVRNLGLGNGYSQSGDLYFSSVNDCSQQKDESDLAYSDACSDKPVDRASTFPRPKVATTSDCHTISLANVVLPLPGFDVTLPSNECGQWLLDLLKDDGFELNDLKHRVKDFTLRGSYRALLVKPTDVNFYVTDYLNPEIPLVKSDLQLLFESQGGDTLQQSSAPSQSCDASTEHPFRAVVIQFSLPKSSYATMAIRELTKSVWERR